MFLFSEIACNVGFVLGTTLNGPTQNSQRVVVCDNDEIIVTDAHERWVRHMGAVLFPWRTGYWLEDKDGKRIKDDNGNNMKNKLYGRATIDNWRDLVTRIAWLRTWKNSMQRSPKEGGETEEETKERERLNRVARRKLCTV